MDVDRANIDVTKPISATLYVDNEPAQRWTINETRPGQFAQQIDQLAAAMEEECQKPNSAWIRVPEVPFSAATE